MINNKTIFAILVFSVLLFSCSLFDKKDKEIAAPYVMKTLSNTDSYDDSWKKVKKLEEDDLPQSALKLVREIYAKANKEGNVNQVIKSSIYKIKYTLVLEEESYMVSIAELDSLASVSKTPQKQILHSVTAQMYWGYYTANRRKFHDRTQTVNFDKADLRTWSLEDIVEQVNQNYLASLSSSDELQEYDISSFKDVLEEDTTVKNHRPTLYDLLAHTALDFFKNTEPKIIKPAYFFKLKDERLYASSLEFSKLNIESKDSTSMKLHALHIYQELIRLHTNKTQNKLALADLELERIQFIKQNNKIENNEEMYLQALENLSSQFKEIPYYAKIRSVVAQYYAQKGEKYNPILKEDAENEILKTYKFKAREIAVEARNKYPNSLGGITCMNFINQIESKTLNFIIEQTVLPNEESKGLLKIKNLSKMYFRAVKLDYDSWNNKKFDDYTEKAEYLIGKSVEKSWDIEVPLNKFYNSHSVEFKIPALKNGCYAILASTNSEFKTDSEAFAFSVFWSTNIRFVHRNAEKTNEFIVLNRKTGHPIEGVTVKAYTEKYSYIKRDYVLKKVGKFLSDKEGYFKISKTNEYRNLKLYFDKGEDKFISSNRVYQNRNNETKIPKPIETGFVYTDRGIYRPGQIVYYKGLLISKLENTSMVVANKKVDLVFFDANNKEVARKTLTTNEYGSVRGQFTSPQGLLNGRMYIEMHLSNKKRVGKTYFRVEEYKRPKFEVTISPLKGEYKLGNKIQVEGMAKALAGNPIDGGKVTYSISRTTTFPWWCGYYYGFSPNNDEIKLKDGNTVTDEKGVFTLSFDAIGDNSVNRKYLPTYSFDITAEVTDINGKTRSASQSVTVGYSSLVLDINVPKEINKNKTSEFTLFTTNLNGEKVGAKGEVIVYKLKSSNRLEVSKLWNNPDLFLYTKEEHDKLFPTKDYGNKTEQERVEEGKIKLASYPFDTKEKDKITFDNLKNWKNGKYKIEIISKDKFGEEVKEFKIVEVYSEQSSTIGNSDYFWSKVEKGTCEPGETAILLIGSRAKDVKVLYEIEYKGKIISKQWITLNNEQRKIEIPIEEKHRGNIAVHFVVAKENRIYNENYVLVVPFTNKQLEVSFETFRNKLLPGQKEKWKVNIKGKKGEKVMAEMLATMYDASLDEFVPHNFGLLLYSSYYSQRAYNTRDRYSTIDASVLINELNKGYIHSRAVSYPVLNWFGMYFYGGYSFKGYGYRNENRYDYMNVSEKEYTNKNEEGVYGKKKKYRTISCPSFGSDYLQPFRGNVFQVKLLSQVKARTNFNETALFLPQLRTDMEGNISFEFEMPESLTKWKFIGLSHTKDLKVGTIQKEVITQKELMVVPNTPRFLREGDKITISSKISNLTEKNLAGTAQLFLMDALTNKPIDSEFKNSDSQKSFTAKSKQSTAVEWEIDVPFGAKAVTYKIVAKAGNFTDGEENALPVLTNRMLVTESLPLPIKKAGTKLFVLDKLKNSGSSTTLINHKLTLEYTSNPAWYVVQAMPYMMEYPYECAEQTFTRFYANSLATHIMNGNPKIQEIVKQWQNNSTDEFLSNLEKNQELKSVLLQETPWVLEAENETERKKRISQLFELGKMQGELSKTLNKLKDMQVSNGGWAWFKGMKESRYITQHIVTGMGYLDNLKVKNIRKDKATWKIIQKAIRYLDNRITEDYRDIKKWNKDYKTKNNISNIHIQYLYSRSFFKDIKIPIKTKEAFDYFLKQSQEYWLSFNNYSKAMTGLANYMYNSKAEVCKKITASLKENSIVHPEIGMYWKGMRHGGYYWYQAPIETQALMIELFDVVANDQETVNELKTWLLKQKQTSDWKTTKATAEACYALLLNGTDLLANDDKVEVKVGGIEIAYTGTDTPTKKVVKVDAGTGYFKTSWSGSEINSSMATISISKKKDGVAWGALYWQYFEDLDKITPHASPLKVKKELFKERNTDKGKVLDPISENNVLAIGDKVIVRIVIESDRNMEYIHLKDMRASGFEPINVLSRYKWQDGLGYYESTKDASTNFFMDYLPRGTFVFEYALRVSQKGNFSNGITSIQSMYAPEFGAHSKGVRVEVK